MLQYRDIKSRHQDAILFFRMGDFYEMFFDDAELAARVLSITLTSARRRRAARRRAGEGGRRATCGSSSAPGIRVAICEQVEDPKLAKGIVRREVIETITPGALARRGLARRGRGTTTWSRSRWRRGRGAAGLRRRRRRPLDRRVPARDPAGRWRSPRRSSRLAPAEVVVPADAELAPRRRRAAHRARALGVRRRRWRARSWPAASTSPRSTASASAPTTTAAVGAAGALLRYLAELQPAGSRTSRAPRCAAPTAISGSTR